MEPKTRKVKIGGSWQKTPEYRSWSHMKSRCYNSNDGAYHYYGGRGIKVCDRWLESFDNFLEDMGKRPADDYSLDRIDTNGNYEPSNCRWANRAVQARNKRRRADNTSGHTNICKTRGGFTVKVHIGTFITLEEAVTVQLKVYELLRENKYHV